MVDDDKDRKSAYFRGTVVGTPGQPLKFTERVEVKGAIETSPLCKAVGETLREYRKAAHMLLEKEYASVREYAPPHLRAPCHIFVLSCSDGVLVRFDLAGEEEPKVRMSDYPYPLTNAAPQFSDQVIHFPVDPTTYVPDAAGPSFTCEVVDANGNFVEHSLFHPVIFASSRLPTGFEMPAPSTRPPCLVSLHKELQVQIHGVSLPADTPLKAIPAKANHFIAQGTMPLPVGWQAIEIYPLAETYWQPQYARGWAAHDLLAAIAQHNAIENALYRLDGRAEAREQHARSIEEFETLLTGPEEPAHQFLKAHPDLICPTHDAVWSKLTFGKHVSDFVFREPPDDYLLVEIEAPYRELFRQDGQQRAELTHAINQIDDWIQYIQDNKATVEQTLGLTGISATPRTLVVMGRSATLSEENRRKLTVIQGQHSKLRILTYDDVIAMARANLERLFGPMSLRAQNLKLYFYQP